MNLFDVFEQTAIRQPDHAAMFGPATEARLPYHELQRQVRETARLLELAGVRPRDCIGLHYPSGLDYIILTYALWCCGACSVPIAVELVEEEKHDICRGICLHGVITPSAKARIYCGEFRSGDAVRLNQMSDRPYATQTCP